MRRNFNKCIILISCLSCIKAEMALSQTKNDSAFTRWSFGIQGSIENNLTQYNNIDGTGLSGFVYRNITGQEYGDFINYYFNSKMSTRTGFIISLQTLEKEYPATNSYPEANYYSRATYSEIPILFSYNIFGHRLLLNTSDGVILGFLNNFSTETIIGNDITYNSAVLEIPSAFQEYIFASLSIAWSPIRNINIAIRSWGKYGLTKQYNFIKSSIISNGWSLELSYDIIKNK